MSSKSASSPLHSARTSHGIYTLGVTGGIGSGKSYIARLLEERGIPVYDTDGELREAMITLCGAGIYAPSGLLDRKALASLIFADRSLLEQVNALVHPAVRRDFVAWREGLSAEGKRLCALESALLLDAGLDAYTDGVLAVLADDTLRLQRAMMRDGVGEEAVRARMQHQMSQEELAQYADFLIYNDEAHPLIPQLDSLFDKLLD